MDIANVALKPTYITRYEGNRWRDWMEELTPPYIQISKTFSSVSIILNVISFLGVVIFSSVRLLLKIKVTKQIFFLKKPKPVPTDRFRFGFLDKNRFKPVLFGFSVWLGFFQVFSGLVHFGFFSFRLIKPNRTEPVGFFKILIGFFHSLVFLVIFFPVFSV